MLPLTIVDSLLARPVRDTTSHEDAGDTQRVYYPETLRMRVIGAISNDSGIYLVELDTVFDCLEGALCCF